MPRFITSYVRLSVAALLAACAAAPEGVQEPAPTVKDAARFSVVAHGETPDGQPTVTLADGRSFTVLRLDELRATTQQFDPALLPTGATATLRVASTALPRAVNLARFSRFGKDQGSRGTCIVFSNVAALEAAYRRQHGLDLDLSEQYLNHVRRVLHLPRPSVPGGLPRAESLPGSWSGGGSYDEQILYLLRAGGVPRESALPYVTRPEFDGAGRLVGDFYDNTTQAGDMPRTPDDWRDYHRGGTVFQRVINDFNLSTRRQETYAIPQPLALVSLPQDALETARFRATDVRRASAADLRSLAWYRTVLASGHEVVFDFANGWTDPTPDDDVWNPSDPVAYGHSMLMVGYDDARGAFLIKNQWGEDGPRWFSYDFVTRGRVYAAHYIAAVADPAAPMLPGPRLLGRWDLRFGESRGRLDISHIPGLYPPEFFEGVAETRLGTYFPAGGNPVRVNGTLQDDNLAFNFDPATPDLPYTDRARGLRFREGRLDANAVVLRGLVRLPGGTDVPFVAVKDNAAPTIRLSTRGTQLMNRRITVHAEVADEEGEGCCPVQWSPPPLEVTSSGAVYQYSTPGPHVVRVSATDAFGVTRMTAIDLHPLNVAPVASISQPSSGTTVTVGTSLTVLGSGNDDNVGPGPGPGVVDCSLLSWWSSNPADSAFTRTGCTFTASFGTTGPRTLTLRVKDPATEALAGEARVQIDVTPRPAGNQPPSLSVTLSAPNFQGGTYDWTRGVTLTAATSDPEGNVPVAVSWSATVLRDDGSVALPSREIASTASATWTPASLSGLSGVPECHSVRGADVRLAARATDSLGAGPTVQTTSIRVVCVPQ